MHSVVKRPLTVGGGSKGAPQVDNLSGIPSWGSDACQPLRAFFLFFCSRLALRCHILTSTQRTWPYLDTRPLFSLIRDAPGRRLVLPILVGSIIDLAHTQRQHALQSRSGGVHSVAVPRRHNIIHDHHDGGLPGPPGSPEERSGDSGPPAPAPAPTPQRSVLREMQFQHQGRHYHEGRPPRRLPRPEQ